MRLISVQTGQPCTLGADSADPPFDRPWTSAIWKAPVQGRVWAGPSGLAGDAQVSRPSHGGSERAVLFYSADHYPRWRAEWGVAALEPGAFGENLTVQGLDEWRVCLGDRFAIGAVTIEVSGPREPCRNLVRRHRRPDLISAIRANRRSGWYGRVIVEGWLEAGLSIALRDRPYPQWPIVRAVEAWRKRAADPATAALLGACPALLADWRARLTRPTP
jgi:MOSC domain-containing protein YiiM